MTLTREEIQGMKPGREMDALIAEKVLGWTDIRRVNPAVIHSFSADGNHANFGFSPVLYKHIPFPLYSTDISAAWEVAEHFKTKDYLYSLKNLAGGKYEFSLLDWGGKCSTYSGQGNTPSEAICKAALIAVLNV